VIHPPPSSLPLPLFFGIGEDCTVTCPLRRETSRTRSTKRCYFFFFPPFFPPPSPRWIWNASKVNLVPGWGQPAASRAPDVRAALFFPFFSYRVPPCFSLFSPSSLFSSTRWWRGARFVLLQNGGCWPLPLFLFPPLFPPPFFVTARPQARGMGTPEELPADSPGPAEMNTRK